jgi:hypothetical protein
MATLTELYDALKNADAAGDTESATIFADQIDAIETQQKAQAQPQQKSTLPEYAGAVIRGLGPTVAGALAGAPGGPPGMLAGMTTVEGGGLIGDMGLSAINAMMGTRFTTPSEGWSYIFDKLGVPKPESEGAKVLEASARGVGSTIGTLGLGSVIKGLAPVGSRLYTVGEALSSSPAQQITGAAVGGATGEAGRAVAEDLGASPLQQAGVSFLAGLSGNTVGSLAGAKAFGKTSPNSVVQAYEDLGLRTPSTSEVMPPRTQTGQWLRRIGVNAPIVGGEARETARANEIAKGLEDLLQSYSITYGQTAPFAAEVVDSLVKTRGAELSKLTGAKRSIIDGLSIGGEVAPMANAVAKIDEEIAKLSAQNPDLFAPIISKFESLKSGIENNTLRNVDVNLKLAGSMLKDPSIASIAGAGEESKNIIYNAIKQDMLGYIESKAGSDVRTTVEEANNALHGMVEELKNKSLKRALKLGDANPDDVGRMLLDTKNPHSFNMIIAGLDDAGKEAAKRSILQSVANSSIDQSTGVLSPTRLRTGLNKVDPHISKLFTADEKKAFDAWATVIERSKLAQEFAIDPATGNRTVAAATVSAVGIPMALALGPASNVYESKGFRDLLLKISANPVNKDALITQAVKQLETSAVKGVADEMISQNLPITFDPANAVSEKVGNGTVTTDQAHGYRAVTIDGKKHRLYGADNQLIGVFPNMDALRKFSDKQVVKKLSEKN